MLVSPVIHVLVFAISMTKFAALVLPLLALLSPKAIADCDFDDFPRLNGMLIGNIADGLQWNNSVMNARSFRVPASPDEVKAFYAKQWQDAVDFTEFGPWQQILHINNQCMMMVQVQAQNSRYSYGKLMLTNPPETDLSSHVLGAGMPVPPSGQVVSDMQSDDKLRKGRLTLLIVAEDIHRTRAWYESEMHNRGWQLEHRSTLANSVVLNYAKGRERMTIGMLPHESNTQVLLTQMDQ